MEQKNSKCESKFGKILTKKTPNRDTFHAVIRLVESLQSEGTLKIFSSLNIVNLFVHFIWFYKHFFCLEHNLRVFLAKDS